MSIIDGHEDLKPKRVLGINADGTLTVDGGDKGLLRYDLFVNANGRIFVQPQPQDLIDQQVRRKRPTAAMRARGIDQLQ